MQARQKQIVEAYQRVQDFLAEYPIPDPGRYGKPKELLDAVVERLTGHTGDQVAGGRLSRAESLRKNALARTLREQHLRPISKIAKAVLRDAPGIQRALKMPSPNLMPTRLIAEALAMKQAVELYSPTFVENGRPADFLEQLDAAIGRLRASLLGRARYVGQKVGARAGLAQEIQRGRTAVDLLDAMVTTAFFGEAEVLARWRAAKRIQGLPGPGSVTDAGTVGTADDNLDPSEAGESGESPSPADESQDAA
ncbi:MAG: hypothetical protein WD801_05785 [Gemmatimonadaceae bacterium]